MTSSMHTQGTQSPSALCCEQCASPLALDQRYCVECGTRRGPLPAPIAELNNRILEQGRHATRLPGEKGKASPPAAGARRARRVDLWSPNPQAAALAVMAMLGFGVIVGDLAGANTNLATLASSASPINVTIDGAFGSRNTNNNSGGGGGGGGSSSSGGSTPSGGGSPASQTQTAAASTSTTGTGSSGGSVPGPLVLPPVKHVFLIVLSNQGYAQSFSAASKDKYLSHTLVKQGEVLPYYYGVAGGSLANEIALVSGQGPTQQTEANCPVYTPIKPFQTASESQIVGSGCVYPSETRNIASELIAKHDSWKAYIDGLQNGPKAQAKSCGVPQTGAADPHSAPTPSDPYVTWRNPFVYFAALTAKPAKCRKTDVPLTTLQHDLKSEKTTPSLVYIAPSACDNGDDQPCKPGAHSGLKPADAFLKRTLALIEKSPAYKASGLIAITFDHAPQTGPHADQSACCSTPTYPNLPATATTPTTTTPTTTTPTGTTPTTTTPTTTTTTPTTTTPCTTTTPTTSAGGGQTNPTGGGGQVGLLLISPYVKPHTSDVIDYYNHFSLLQGIEALFKVKSLGLAADASLPRFQPQLYDYHKP